jgi:hypothetical protein
MNPCGSAPCLIGTIRTRRATAKPTFVALSLKARQGRRNDHQSGSSYTRPPLRALGPFLQEPNPILEWFELHNHLIADFLGNGASATKDTIPSAPANEPGHYLRQLSVSGVEALGVFRERNSTNRGNAYPSPMQLDVRYVRHSIFGNWDCVPSGGE